MGQSGSAHGDGLLNDVINEAATVQVWCPSECNSDWPMVMGVGLCEWGNYLAKRGDYFCSRGLRVTLHSNVCEERSVFVV